MLKIRAKENVIVLGLSEMNIKRLREGKPIKFNLKELGMSDIDILIFTGRDEHTMAEEFKQFIGPETKVYIDPKLNFQ